MVFSSLLTSLLSTLSFGILLYEICSSEEDDGRSVKDNYSMYYCYLCTFFRTRRYGV